MRKKYLLLLLVALAMGLGGCPCDKKHFAPPPEPGVPSSLIATAVSSTQINLAWRDNSIDEKGFYVYRRKGGNYRRIVALDPNTISYNDTGLNPRTIYWYKVTAFNDGGESGSSNEASATTLVEVEILDFYMEKHYWERDGEKEWYTWIKGHMRNNTDQVLTHVELAGEFYSYTDEWIGIEYCVLENVNPGIATRFEMWRQGKTEIKYVKVWVQEYC